MSATVGYCNAIKELLAHADGMVQNLAQRTEHTDQLELLDRVHRGLLRDINDLRTYAIEHDLESTLMFSLNSKRKHAEVLNLPLTANGASPLE